MSRKKTLSTKMLFFQTLLFLVSIDLFRVCHALSIDKDHATGIPKPLSLKSVLSTEAVATDPNSAPNLTKPRLLIVQLRSALSTIISSMAPRPKFGLPLSATVL